uniref:Uncharacterized protein n=1 Tax=Helianthus annuus TaxID=4232 RepID=A0A251S036_HELAN
MELARETYTEKRRDNRGCRDLLFPPSVLSTTVQASATPPRRASYATFDLRDFLQAPALAYSFNGTVDELGLQRTLVIDHLEELERLLNGISVLKEPVCGDYNKTHSWIMVSAYKRRQLKFHMKIIHQRSLKDCTSRD